MDLPRHQKLTRRHLLCLLGSAVLAAPLASWADPAPSKGVKLYGRSYIDLSKIAAQLGMKFSLSKNKREATLSSRWTKLVFKGDSRLVTLNGYKLYLGHAVAANKGKMYLGALDHDKAIKPLLTPQVFSRKPQLRTIVIDPGHGGKDPGCTNKNLGLVEKKLTLDTAQRLKKELQRRGYRVYLTRETDKTLPNAHRSAFANKKNADLFICLHYNSVNARSVKGIETYAFTPQNQPSTARSKLSSSDRRSYSGNINDAWNVLSGFYVQRQLIKNMRSTDRGLKRARFSMMTGLKCPGLLIEGGFFSHYEEAKQIKQSSHRNRLAATIMEGVVAYHKTLTRISNPKV